MRARELLSKAKRGEIKAGHKYRRKYRGKDGAWVYVYEEPRAAVRAPAPSSSEDRLRKLRARQQARTPELLARYGVQDYTIDPESPPEPAFRPLPIEQRARTDYAVLAELTAMIIQAGNTRPALLDPESSPARVNWRQLQPGQRIVATKHDQSYRDTFVVKSQGPGGPDSSYAVTLERVERWRGFKYGEFGEIFGEGPPGELVSADDLPATLEVGQENERGVEQGFEWMSEAEYLAQFPPPSPGQPLSPDMHEIDLAKPYSKAKGTPGDAIRARKYLEQLFRGVHGPAPDKPPHRSALILAAQAIRAIDEALGGDLPFPNLSIYLNTPMPNPATGAFYQSAGVGGRLVFDQYYESAAWHEFMHAVDDYLGAITDNRAGDETFVTAFASENLQSPLSAFARLAHSMPSQRGIVARIVSGELGTGPGRTPEQELEYFEKPREVLARFGEHWMRYRLRAKGWKGGMPIHSTPEDYTEAEMRFLSPLFEATLRAYGILAKSRRGQAQPLLDRGVLVVELRKGAYKDVMQRAAADLGWKYRRTLR